MPADTPPKPPDSSSTGNRKVPGKPRNPKDVLPIANAPRSKEEAVKKVEDVAKAAAVKGAASAANSVAPGAGKVVEKLAKTKTGQKVLDKGVKVAKSYTKLMAGFLAAALILLASMCSGGDSATPLTSIAAELSVEELAAKLNIPVEHLRAYQEQAEEYDVPWSLLSAAAYNASRHGVQNPYGNAKQNAEKLTLIGDIFAPATGEVKGVGDIIKDSIDKTDTSRTSATSTTKATATALVKKPLAPGNVVVVHPFSRDLTDAAVRRYGASMKALMLALGTGTTVYWLTVPGQDNGINIAIRSAPDNYSNLYVVDWSAKRAEVPDLLDGSDAINSAHASLITETLAPVTSIENSEESDDCPVSSPAIEPLDKDDTKGFGPLMLRASRVPDKSSVTAPNYPELQSLCFSLDILASAIVEAAELVADDEGVAYPAEIQTQTQAAQDGDPDAAKYVNEFWAAAMGRVSLLGDIVGQVCEIIPQGEYERRDWVALAIADYWACVLEKEKDLHHVTDVVVLDGVVSYTESSNPVDAIVQEALDVAWLTPNQSTLEYAQYGDKLAPSKWDDSYCNPGNEFAGVFPLTKDQFTKGLQSVVLSNKREGKTFVPTGDRCNPELNIIVAARLFIDGEKVAPSLRPNAHTPSRYEKMIGGWALIGDATTSTPDFNSIGPWENFVCTDQPDFGKRVLQDAAIAASSTGSVPDVEAFLKNPELTTIPDALKVKAAEMVELVRTTCGVSAANMDAELYSYIGKFTNDSIDPTEPAASYYAALGTAATVYVTSTDLYYSGSLVSRLTNLMPRQVRYDDLPEISLDSVKSLGYLLVNIARERYEGVFLGGGSSPSEAGMVGSEVEFYAEFNAVGTATGIDPRLLSAIAEYGSSFDPQNNCDLRADTTGDIHFGLMYIKADPNVCDMSTREQIEAAAEKLKGFYTTVREDSDTEDDSIEDYRAALLLYYVADANTAPAYISAWENSKGDVAMLQKRIVEVYIKNGKDPATAKVLAEDAVKFIGAQTAGAYQLWQDNRARYSYATTDGTIIGESVNCPTTYPASQIAGLTLVQRTDQGQDEAEAKFLYNLCVDSVNSALDIYAAKAITYTFNNLGVVYDQTKRASTTFDCSSFVSTAYMYAGVPMGTPSSPYLTTQLLPRGDTTLVDHIRPVEGGLLKREPGDLFFPIEGHVAMVLARNYTISAPGDGKITYVGPLYTGDINRVNRVHGADAQPLTIKVKLQPRRGDKNT